MGFLCFWADFLFWALLKCLLGIIIFFSRLLEGKSKRLLECSLVP